MRPTEPLRVGTDSAEPEAQRVLSKAVGQINRTAQLIRERHPALDQVPDDRPLVGIVVTMEPFFAINSPFLRDWLPKADVTMTIASVAALEHLVDLDEALGDVRLDKLDGPDTAGWSLGSLLVGRPRPRATWSGPPHCRTSRSRWTLRGWRRSSLVACGSSRPCTKPVPPRRGPHRPRRGTPGALSPPASGPSPRRSSPPRRPGPRRSPGNYGTQEHPGTTPRRGRLLARSPPTPR
jgi:hypothetical protein